MKKLFLVVIVALVMACGPSIPDYWTKIAEEDTAYVTSDTYESFSVPGAAIGYMVGGGMSNGGTASGLLWGVALGSAMADGCRIYFKDSLFYKTNLAAPSSYCRSPQATYPIVRTLYMHWVDGTLVEYYRRWNWRESE